MHERIHHELFGDLLDRGEVQCDPETGAVALVLSHMEYWALAKTLGAVVAARGLDARLARRLADIVRKLRAAEDPTIPELSPLATMGHPDPPRDLGPQVQALLARPTTDAF